MNRTKFIVAGNLIDGDGVDGRKDVLLTVRDGIITAIGAAADLCRHDGATIIDCSHCTIVPALFDCSVSLLSDNYLGR